MNHSKKIGLGILKMLGLVALVLVVNITPMYLLLFGTQYNFPVYLEISLTLVYLAAVFFIIRTLWRAYHKHVPEEARKQRFTWADFGIALLFFLGVRVASIVGLLINVYLTGNTTTANQGGLDALGETMSVNHLFFALLYVMTISFIVPIVEELVFRAFATLLFFEKKQKWLAALVTSILFALPHITRLEEFPLYFGMGLVLFFSFARRWDIRDSILVHILTNLPLALLMLYAMFIPAG